MSTTKIIDQFIHQDHFSNTSTLRKARLLVRASFLTSMFSASYILSSYLLSFEKGVYVLVFNVVGFLLLPFLVKLKIPILWLGNLYVFIGAFAVVVLTYYSGGLWSPIYSWLISIPVLALLVTNRVSAISWGVISFSVMVWLSLLAYHDISVPLEIDQSYKTISYIVVIPGLLFLILFMALIFESNQQKALSMVEDKNRELEEKNATIEKQSNDVSNLLIEKSYLIRILAHDLKNPLANITILTHILNEEKDPEPRKNYIELISVSSSKAQDLIDKVLEMDKSEEKELNPSMERLNVCTICSEAVTLMSETARNKRIKLINKLPKQALFIEGDRTFLYLVFENLLSNALKFSEKDKSVMISIERNTDKIKIVVSDQGVGVHPDEQNQLFKTFSKLSNRPTDGESSSGLGLSLVMRYVMLMNGRIWYEDRPNLGATFVVEFSEV